KILVEGRSTPLGPKFYRDPKTGYRVKWTAYKCRVPIEFHPLRLKKNSPERILEVEPKEDPEEEKEEPKKKKLKEASKIDSNTRPLDNSTSNKEIYSELQSTARSEAKPKKLQDTYESSVRPKIDSPQTILAYMLQDFPSRLS
ncbi:hypothetical protein Tco_1188860, partial [Tanacetum coccineum]